LKGVVDLVKMKAIYWDDATGGTKFEMRDIPAELQAECDGWREKLVEAGSRVFRGVNEQISRRGRAV
jgi:elongation factor G